MNEQNQNSWTDDEIKNAIDKAKESGLTKAAVTKKISEIISRNMLIIGCGDGGCNIANAIHAAIPDTYAIAYNTSSRAMDKLKVDVTIIPTEEDGSGKDRSYSQDVFKKGSFKKLLENVVELSTKIKNLSYILVTSTADGGTGGGVSPMVAKFISDNVPDIPVIILGVYPSLKEDATAQFNALSWQSDVEKTGLPYIILDNNDTENAAKVETHNKVNKQAADVISILAGVPFGETNISSIDNRDMHQLLSTIGGRIHVMTDTHRPTVGVPLDDYLESMISKWNEPGPDNTRGLGLFLKGPKDFIQKYDTSLMKFRSIHGDAVIQYVHIEESDETQVALVSTGCTEPTDRLMSMRQRYDDIIQEANRNRAARVDTVLDGASNPLGERKTRMVAKGAEIDMSALGM